MKKKKLTTQHAPEQEIGHAHDRKADDGVGGDEVELRDRGEVLVRHRPLSVYRDVHGPKLGRKIKHSPW